MLTKLYLGRITDIDLAQAALNVRIVSNDACGEYDVFNVCLIADDAVANNGIPYAGSCADRGIRAENGAFHIGGFRDKNGFLNDGILKRSALGFFIEQGA